MKRSKKKKKLCSRCRSASYLFKVTGEGHLKKEHYRCSKCGNVDTLYPDFLKDIFYVTE